MKDYYKILQVASDASPEVIQMAYKALAKKYHPDLNPGQEEAMQEKMKDLNGDGWSPYGAVAYGGSALFIDGVGENGKMNSGYGDIKISGKDMTKLLSYLDSDYNPTITIRAAQ